MQTPALTDQSFFDALGMSDVPQNERDALVAEIGSIVLESAFFRFVTSATSEEAEALTTAFEGLDGESPETMEALFTTFPLFGQYVSEEIETFRSDAVHTLGTENVGTA